MKQTTKLDISTKKYPNTYTLIDADMYEELSKYKWFKGVMWDKKRMLWFARIGIKNKKINLGYYKAKEEADLAYNIAAKKYHGNFAYQNQIINSNLENV